MHRGTSLTKQGIIDLFNFARDENAGLTFSTIPERKAAKGITEDDVVLPLDQDGANYYAAIYKYVTKYLGLYYPEGKCSEDIAVQRWMSKANSIAPNRDLPQVKSCEDLRDVLSTFMYLVSAGHRMVGTIGAELEDPCHAPWGFREGEVCGTPRTFYTQALTMALTSHEQPRILDGYSHMWNGMVKGDAAKALWASFESDLRQVENVVNMRNVARKQTGVREYKVFLPSQIETSIGI